MEIAEACQRMERLRAELRKAIAGQDEVLEQMLVVLLARGHALLEGVPGVAKTLMARTLARAAGVAFRRIQFTPDLMPSDILGVNVYNTATGAFTFRPGPLFADLILGDEINRTPAKTQAALLEAMQERQATVDGVSHPLGGVFTVFATQNPVEFEGTYPLPEAQVDRFMLKIAVAYPDEEVEASILDRAHDGFDASDLAAAHVEPVLGADALAALRALADTIRVEPIVRRYITQLVRATRTPRQVELGASPRAGVMLLQAARAHALLEGRPYVTPDHVQAMARPVLRHRILLSPEAEVEGQSSDDCIGQVLAQVPVPR